MQNNDFTEKILKILSEVNGGSKLIAYKSPESSDDKIILHLHGIADVCVTSSEIFYKYKSKCREQHDELEGFEVPNDVLIYFKLFREIQLHEKNIISYINFRDQLISGCTDANVSTGATADANAGATAGATADTSEQH